eukprot:TRINITY_DN4328_c0_g2_i6.p1 TRINITY_DN4328_c0_g2~~TRINITY_DN4328_c0_g2_i6.p1  ORF type:complete len:281 (+),score=31.67 TRINITY_DN4328_c0_g2_i6:42-884(+)
MAASTVSTAASWSSAVGPAMYLDEHGFIINNQTPPVPMTQRQADKDNKKLDKWMKMLVRWEDTAQDYPRLKKRIRLGGIPSSLRGLAWQLLLGSRQKQAENNGLYESLAQREMDAGLAEIIKRDLGRTFPTHALFLGPDGVGQKALFSLLHAYAVYDPKIGYCQGMGFIAATLLTQMKEEEAFWAFVVLMKHPKYALELQFLYFIGRWEKKKKLERESKNARPCRACTGPVGPRRGRRGERGGDGAVVRKRGLHGQQHGDEYVEAEYVQWGWEPASVSCE